MGVDWATLICDLESVEQTESRLEDVHALLTPHFGTYDSRGHRFYQGTRVYSGYGVRVSFGRPPQGACEQVLVSLSGEALASLEDSGVPLLRRLWAVGFRRATRIDTYVDFRGPSLKLLDQVESAASSGEYLGPKTHSIVLSGNGKRGQCVGRTVYFGLRGSSGSGTFIRVYDKGLEQRTHAPNEWIRFEVEHSKDKANLLYHLLLNATPDNAGFGGYVVLDPDCPFDGAAGDGRGRILAGESWAGVAESYTLGALDFRDRLPGRWQVACRRKRCDWWADILTGIDVKRLKSPNRVRKSYEGFKGFFKRAIAPTAKAMATASGWSMAAVLAELTGPESWIAESRPGQVVREFLESVGAVSGPAIAWRSTSPQSTPGQGGDSLGGLGDFLERSVFGPSLGFAGGPSPPA